MSEIPLQIGTYAKNEAKLNIFHNIVFDKNIGQCLGKWFHLLLNFNKILQMVLGIVLVSLHC